MVAGGLHLCMLHLDVLLELVDLHLLEVVVLVFPVLLEVEEELLETLLLEEVLQLFLESITGGTDYLLFRRGIVELRVYLCELQVLLLQLEVQLAVRPQLSQSLQLVPPLTPLLLQRRLLTRLLTLRLVLILLLTTLYVFLLPQQSRVVSRVQLVLFQVLQVVLFQLLLLLFTDFM